MHSDFFGACVTGRPGRSCGCGHWLCPNDAGASRTASACQTRHAPGPVSAAVPEIGAERCHRKVGGHVAGNFRLKKPLRALDLCQEKRVAGHSAHTEGKFSQLHTEATMTRLKSMATSRAIVCRLRKMVCFAPLDTDTPPSARQFTRRRLAPAGDGLLCTP